MDIDRIKKIYEGFTDAQIRELARSPKELESNVLPILEAEIQKRGLRIGTSTLTLANLSGRPLDEVEFAAIGSLLHVSNCPKCKKLKPLFISKFKYVTGLVVFHVRSDLTLVACKSCCRKEQAKSVLWNLGLGWWTIVSFFKTPYLLFSNIFASIQSVESEVFRTWIEKNRADFRDVLNHKKNKDKVLSKCHEHSEYIDTIDFFRFYGYIYFLKIVSIVLFCYVMLCYVELLQSLALCKSFGLFK